MSLQGITKRYGANLVLDGIDLDVRAGQCVGLLGENGAGKSTLVGIMSGKTPATAGSVLVDGAPRVFRQPRDAREHGVQLIPQELAYLPDLSLAENLVLPNWPGGFGFTQRGIRRTAREALDRVGIDLDVRRPMVELSLAERQLVEIAKALLGEGRLLILDEPTASLHARETELLLAKLHELKAAGVAMVYVSHHLDETFAISDDIVVLRNGVVAAHEPADSITQADAVAAMLGPQYEAPEGDRVEVAGRRPSIALRSWSTATKPSLDDCSIDVLEGEVLGVFGLVGSGAETIARALGGHQKGVAGTVVVDEREQSIPRNPRAALRLGIGYVPAERKTDGLALNQSIADNITVSTLGRYSAAGFLRRRAQLREADALATGIEVKRASVRQEVGELSGGNQQKVVLASRLTARPRILVLHEPTRGVDIGSRARIHRELAAFADEGRAVLLVTSDVQEAIDATDRLLVMRDGTVVAELSGIEKTTANALALAAGGAG
jgi:ABC-type sugar transport system ATPase subunit